MYLSLGKRHSRSLGNGKFLTKFLTSKEPLLRHQKAERSLTGLRRPKPRTVTRRNTYFQLPK
jgi:hypothetical protein